LEGDDDGVPMTDLQKSMLRLSQMNQFKDIIKKEFSSCFNRVSMDLNTKLKETIRDLEVENLSVYKKYN